METIYYRYLIFHLDPDMIANNPQFILDKLNLVSKKISKQTLQRQKDRNVANVDLSLFYLQDT